jgi:hypothetical protein
MRYRSIAIAIPILAASALLSGCGVNADFGRVRPTMYNDDVHAWMGPVTTREQGDPVWRHGLTDEERRLRDLAYPLIDPPYDRNKWYSFLGELGLGSRTWPYPDRNEYASRLFTTAYRSQTARYNKLIEDIRADVIRLDPFFQTAHYVKDMDEKRAKALGYVSNLTAEESNNTKFRMAENSNVIRWVQGSLDERVASYRVALERMVIAAPSPIAVEAERQLTLLQQRISQYNSA